MTTSTMATSTHTLTTPQLLHALSAAHAAVLAHQDNIAALDQAIGDGDHVYNLLRGLETVLERREELLNLDLAPALKAVATTLLQSIGGSAGPLLASLVLGMAKTVREPVTAAVFAEMLGAGVDAMRQRGKAELGQKTMLDVLIPVAECLRLQASSGAPTEDTVQAVRRCAEDSMLGTRDMIATKGRAAFLGERSRGVIDPGARSTQVMIHAVCDLLSSRPDVSPAAPPLHAQREP